MSSFDEYLATSKRANSRESLERRAIFARSYVAATQLIELRRKRGITQKQLAALTGVAQSEISRIERGVVHPTDITLAKLADAMDADVRIVERSLPSNPKREAFKELYRQP
ncbi:MAG: helix-turn-helix transcriptional regulator [Actinomycetota bacterium]